MKVQKRDGRIVEYNADKITAAIKKANVEVDNSQKVSDDLIEEAIGNVEKTDKEVIPVETIQDIIEKTLVAHNKYVLAKKYMIYRYQRSLLRKSNTTDESILKLIRNENKELAEENSNKNTVHASTQRDYIAGEVSRDLTRRMLLPEHITMAHQNGILHFHTEKIRAAIRKATTQVKFVPIVCGTSYKNKGVQKLLDAIVDYMPSPLDIPPITGTVPKTDEVEHRAADDSAPFSALAFKIMTDPYVGRLAFFRVYSGTIEAGKSVLNSTKGQRERLGRILLMHANHREDITQVYSGDIAAAVGLKNTTTGDTLCDEKNPIVLESMEFPEPVIRVAIEPKTKAGQEKMDIALAKLAEEDPTFKAYTDEETGQTIIAGMGELHLEIIVDRLLREFRVEANVGRPQVSYKETITKAATVDTRYARQTGGKGQFAHVKLTIEPNEPGKGYEFVNAITGGAIPKEFIPCVDQGIQGAMQAGVLAGYEVVDVKVTLIDGSYHEVDSSEMAFKICGSMAFKEACQKAGPTLLEPIMKVVVTAPESYMGDVMGDINARRGQIAGTDIRNGAAIVTANVPLASMFGYATDLRSKTQGRATYSMEPSHFVELPKSLQEKIIHGSN